VFRLWNEFCFFASQGAVTNMTLNEMDGKEKRRDGPDRARDNEETPKDDESRLDLLQWYLKMILESEDDPKPGNVR
jgi:hypothetical protein